MKVERYVKQKIEEYQGNRKINTKDKLQEIKIKLWEKFKLSIEMDTDAFNAEEMERLNEVIANELIEEKLK